MQETTSSKENLQVNERNLKRKQKAAISKIISRSRLNDVRFAGEIHAGCYYIITDGKVAIFSKESFGEHGCITSDEMVNSYLLAGIHAAISNSRVVYKIKAPFELKKVATSLPDSCKQYGDIDKYGRNTVTFTATNSSDEIRAKFDSKDLFNAFDMVGRKAVGEIISNKDYYNGIPFLYVHADQDNRNIEAIVLQANDKNSLFRETTIGYVDKVQRSIGRIKSVEPYDGYYLAFSGGKDSQCIYHLAKMAGVKFDAHYSVTTVDPPELIRFIKKEYQDVKWEFPLGQDGKRTSMFKLISEEHTIPPTRVNRYCCSVLKENGGIARLVMTGVRWSESIKRRDSHGVVDVITSSSKLHNDSLQNNSSAQVNKFGSIIFMDDNDETRKTVERCYIRKKTTLNPIVDWTDEDVWNFLNEVAKVPHCSLYDDGFERLGCVGCPLAGRESMERDFYRSQNRHFLGQMTLFPRILYSKVGEVVQFRNLLRNIQGLIECCANLIYVPSCRIPHHPLVKYFLCFSALYNLTSGCFNAPFMVFDHFFERFEV